MSRAGEWTDVEQAMAAAGIACTVVAARPVGGGCIHAAWCLQGSDGRRYFVKTNDPGHAAAFACEATSLQALAATGAVRVPAVLACAARARRACLVLEWLDMLPGNSRSQAELGRQLAALHRHCGPAHGWDSDNCIGASPQVNRRTENWAAFFRDCRLRPQIDLAQRNGLRLAQADRLLAAVPDLLAGHAPAPSLLHGDLWGGNAARLADDTPVIFDPACYHGDRETDLAFSELFGGFSPAFYAAYTAAWPLAPGYPRRKPLYNLYHVLNHANLFGGGYGRQAAEMIRSLLTA